MNSKIKNYVDVLFKDIPNTKRAQELKEELLSTLNDHFEGHIAEGKSENQAYTEALADLGNIDELLKDLEPEKELKSKIDNYRRIKARNTSISVMLFILSIVFVILFSTIPEITGKGNTEFMTIIGVVFTIISIAAGTGLLIYTHLSIPQDVAQYISRKNSSASYYGNSSNREFIKNFNKIFGPIILIIYLVVSFKTGAWHITWLIWIIGAAIKNAILSFMGKSEDNSDSTDSN